MMTDAPKKTPKMSRGWRIVLVVSLGLNLAIVGMFAGAAFRHGGPDRDRSRHDPMVRALDTEARREIGREIRKQRSSSGAMRSELSAVYTELLTVLRAEQFDAEAMRAAMARKSAVLRKTRDVGETALIAHMSGLSKEARAAFADRLEETLAKKRR